MRRNVSTPGFGRLSRVTGLHGPPEAAVDHIIFGVNDRSRLLLRPAGGNFPAATVRPMSRKDIFYSGSVMHLAVDTTDHQEPHVPDTPTMAR